MISDREKKKIRMRLNHAVTEVASKQWTRLTGKIKNQIYNARFTEKSLHSLDRLKQGNMPNYDDWDALFYPTWYQPRQVNLVYSILNGIKINGKDRGIFGLGEKKIRFIDFGCGCLATNIAVAMCAADLAARDHKVPEIEIDNIDNSPEMILVGERIWELFQNKMKISPSHPICNVFDRVSYNTHTSISTLTEQSTQTPCYVTVIHCAYKQSQYRIKKNLEELVHRFDPSGLFLTTHSSKKEVLRRLTPYQVKNSQRFSVIHTGTIYPQYRGKADRITKWRSDLYDRHLRPPKIDAPKDVDYSYIEKYLSNPVKWDSDDSETLLYMRREMNKMSQVRFNHTYEVDDLPF